MVKCGETNIPGKEVIVYTKQTQTTATGQERDGKFNYYFLLIQILTEV